MGIVLRNIQIRNESGYNTSTTTPRTSLHWLHCPKYSHTTVCRQQHASRLFYSIHYPTVEFALRTLRSLAKACMSCNHLLSSLRATPTYLGDSQPDVFVPHRVAEAQPQLLGFVGTGVESLELAGLAAGVDCVDTFFLLLNTSRHRFSRSGQRRLRPFQCPEVPQRCARCSTRRLNQSYRRYPPLHAQRELDHV